MSEIAFERWMALAGARRSSFASAQPFPHTVIDDFLPEEVATAVAKEFDAGLPWKHYSHYNERKLAVTDAAAMPPTTRDVFVLLQSQRFIDFVARLTGVDGLIPDPALEGAGMHMTRTGGYLNVHTDFLTHTTQRSWRRQVNLLVYLNREWQSDWNGALELWTDDMKERVEVVEPVFNRCVIFRTLPRSYHGHPLALACPPGESRKSLAIYYYRDVGEEASIESTDYRALPDDSLARRALIAADRRALSVYTWLKGRLGLSDQALTRWLERLERR